MGPDSGWYCPMRRCELAEEGESAHRVRGHPRSSSCTAPRTRSGVGDPAATLSDDSKRYVNGAGPSEVVCSLVDGLELTVPVDLGVGRPRDEITAVVFARDLLSSGFVVNTIYGQMLVGESERRGRRGLAIAERPLSWGMVRGGRG